jgi:hypothetical protein
MHDAWSRSFPNACRDSCGRDAGSEWDVVLPQVGIDVEGGNYPSKKKKRNIVNYFYRDRLSLRLIQNVTD